MTTILWLLAIGFVVYRATSPEERRRAVRIARAVIQELAEFGRKELEPFHQALRARTPWPAVTFGLVALDVVVFLLMLPGGAGRGPVEQLVAWGASFGPRSTNGEWWRLVSAMFVHAGLMGLLANVAATLQLGLTLERLVGPFAFLTTYVIAGVLAGLVSLSTGPMTVSAGASAALFGLYGLLIVSCAAGWWRRSAVTIPTVALKRLVPVSVIFIGYNLVNQTIGTGAELVGFAAGLVLGLAMATDVSLGTPSWRRIAVAMGSGLAVAAAAALTLRGITDVRPEIGRLVAVEQETKAAYQTATERFRKGRMTAKEMAEQIERSIVPVLQAADARIVALKGVPREDEHRVVDAREYLRLRAESWRLQAQGLRDAGATPPSAPAGQNGASTFRAQAEKLHRATTRTLGNAESRAREALAVLDRLQQ